MHSYSNRLRECGLQILVYSNFKRFLHNFLKSGKEMSLDECVGATRTGGLMSRIRLLSSKLVVLYLKRIED